MTLYLSREKYLQYYGEYSELNTQQYTSVEEIAAHEKDYAEKGYDHHFLRNVFSVNREVQLSDLV